MKKLFLLLVLVIGIYTYTSGEVLVELKFKNFNDFEDINYFRVSCGILRPGASSAFSHGLFDKNGSFFFTADIDYPSLIRINWYNKSIVLPVFPNDSIKLEIDLSSKSYNINSLILHHAKSQIETDAFIYNLNKDAEGITDKSSSNEVAKKYISRAQTKEQKFFSILYLCFLNQQSVSIKNQKLRFLAFEEVFSQYPEASRYDEVLSSKIAKEKSDIIIYDDKFSEFSALLEKIKEKHKGETVFIDLWGTWCGACLYDIKHKKRLGMDEVFQEFKVKTVYLCATSPPKEFDYYINKLNMKGEHYFLSKELANDAKENFKVSFYPHYMFISRKGELINNVPRPIITSKSIANINPKFIEKLKQLSK
jgi:thiol-disulfide isomerase/thioredoxin